MRIRRITKIDKSKLSKINYLKITSTNPLDYTIKQVTPRPNEIGEECDWAIIDSCGNIIDLSQSPVSCKSRLRQMIEYFIIRKNITKHETPEIKTQLPDGISQDKRPCPFCKSVGIVDNKCMACRKVRVRQDDNLIY